MPGYHCEELLQQLYANMPNPFRNHVPMNIEYLLCTICYFALHQGFDQGYVSIKNISDSGLGDPGSFLGSSDLI